MLKLTKNDKVRLMGELIVNGITINGKKYYSKGMYTGVTELLVERLSKLVGINTAHYELVNVQGDYYYLSEQIKGNGIFLTASQIGIHSSNLYDIKNFLENNYSKQAMDIMHEIIKIYLFDILILNADRVNSNWGFIVNDDKIENVYIFDNELSFNYESPVMLTAKGNNNFKYTMLDNWNTLFKSTQENIKELEFFLSNHGEYMDTFLSMYEKLTPQVVRDVYESIIKEVGNHKVLNNTNFLLVYTESYRAIGKLLKIRGLTGNSRKLVK